MNSAKLPGRHGLAILPVLATVGLIVSLSVVAFADPAGMACHIEGHPEFKADGPWKPLHLLQRLEPGTEVRCSAGSKAVVVLYAGGGRYEIGGGANAVITDKSVSGATFLGGAGGAAANVGRRLAGARNGAVMARQAASQQRLHFQNPDQLARPGVPPSPDWLTEGERAWQMNGLAGAASYRFTIFDSRDFVVYSAVVPAPAGGDADSLPVTIPADLKLILHKPYVWRLHGFNADGKLLPESRWGLLTVLSDADSDDLKSAVHDIVGPGGKLPDDPTQLALLADLYSGYGVLENSLEVLDSEAMSREPGVQESRSALIARAGNYARMLSDAARRQNEDMGANQ